MLPKNIISELKLNPDYILRKLYTEYRNEFTQWSINYFNSSIEEAQDLFSDCLIVFYENVITGKLISLTSSIKTYIYAVAKNKMKEYQRKRNKIFNANAEMLNDDDNDEKEDKIMLIEEVFEGLGEPCHSILRLFYYHGKSYTDIAMELSYKNIDTVKSSKYKCLQRLKELVLQKASN